MILDPPAAGTRPTTLDLRRLHLPLRRPHVAAHGVETIRDLILVGWWGADGTVGWGECPTMGSGYGTSTDVAWRLLTEYVAPAVMAEGVGAAREPSGRVGVAASVVDAACDAMWRATGIPAAVALGASSLQLPRTRVVAAAGEAPTTVAARAVEAFVRGAAQVKVKIRPGNDVELLRAVREVAGDLPVAADANGSYASFADVPSELDEFGLAYLEDPVAELDELAALAARFRTPLAWDEPVVDTASALASAAAGAALVSVKPSRVGGLVAAARLGVRLSREGVGCFVGGMLESGVGRAGAVAVAATPPFLVPTDLGPSDAYFEQDVCRPVLTDEDGRLLVPMLAGIGREPSDAALRRFTVDRRRLGRSATR